jgi:hypothetical protein
MADPTPDDVEAIKARYARWQTGNEDNYDVWTMDADIGTLLAALAEAQRERAASVSFAEFADGAVTRLADERDEARRDLVEQLARWADLERRWLAERRLSENLGADLAAARATVQRVRELADYWSGFKDPYAEIAFTDAGGVLLAWLMPPCPRCGHSPETHWPDDEPGQPGCHQGGCLCSWTPDEVSAALVRVNGTPVGPVIGYAIGGTIYDPCDVTIVRRDDRSIEEMNLGDVATPWDDQEVEQRG